METLFEIEGMSCDRCVGAVRRALESLPGVRAARVEVGRAVVVADAPPSRDVVERALADEDYRLRA